MSLQEGDLAACARQLEHAQSLFVPSGQVAAELERVQRASAWGWASHLWHVRQVAMLRLRQLDGGGALSELRARLADSERSLTKALDGAVGHLGNESYNEAAAALDTAAVIGKRDARVRELRDLTPRLQELSAKMSDLTEEASKRLNAHDLAGARSALDQHLQLRTSWDSLKPRWAPSTSAWSRLAPRTQESLVDSGERRLGQLEGEHANAVTALDVAKMAEIADELAHLQANDPRLVGWREAIVRLEDDIRRSNELCARISEALGQRDVDQARRLRAEAQGQVAIVLQRCASLPDLETAAAAVAKARLAFEQHLSAEELNKASRALDDYRQYQAQGLELEVLQQRLAATEERLENLAQKLGLVESSMARGDLEQALLLWSEISAEDRQRAGAGVLGKALEGRKAQYDEVLGRLDAAVSEQEGAVAAQALLELKSLQSSGPVVQAAERRVATVLEAYRQRRDAAVTRVAQALSAKDLPAVERELEALQLIIAKDAEALEMAKGLKAKSHELAIALATTTVERALDSRDLGLAQSELASLRALVDRLNGDSSLVKSLESRVTGLRLELASEVARKLLAEAEPNESALTKAANELEAAGGDKAVVGRLRIKRWADILEVDPSPKVITRENFRSQITATGMPWKVRDRATGIQLVLIPPGEYRRGESAQSAQLDNESPRHKVTITRAFYLGRCEVTQAEWRKVMNQNPSYAKGDTLPVDSVSWVDVGRFLRKANGLRLPTEGEWEYACRAGTSGPTYGKLDDIAWHEGNTFSATRKSAAEVGTKAANGFGLHDMLGNVWEWCSDRAGEYTVGALVDPQGPETGDARVLRGGAWINNWSDDCRASTRNFESPSANANLIGFRVARSP